MGKNPGIIIIYIPNTAATDLKSRKKDEKLLENRNKLKKTHSEFKASEDIIQELQNGSGRSIQPI